METLSYTKLELKREAISKLTKGALRAEFGPNRGATEEVMPERISTEGATKSRAKFGSQRVLG